MKWMKEFWIYTIKNLTLIDTIFFSSLNIITLTEFDNYLQLHLLGGDLNFIEEYDAPVT